MTAIQTIQADINPDAIKRVPAFFNAGLNDILTELLQNSRRAGATHIEITSDEQSVTISDNGIGVRDPQDLLSFGGSEWERLQVKNEHPAGMGLYALARCEQVKVQSKYRNEPTWTVDLKPPHFTGQESAQVKPCTERTPTGTTITFIPPEQLNESHVKVSARYFPIPVTYNGQSVNQSDFLEDALNVHQWRGLRIGVTNRRYSPSSGVNFHGMMLKATNHLPAVETIRDGFYSVRIDVVDCPQLEITLPARKELVETPFLEELRLACLHAIYDTISKSVQAVDVSRQHQQEAAAMGIRLPDARRLLTPWQPVPDWKRVGMCVKPETVYSRDLTIDGTVMTQEQEHTLARAINQSQPKWRLFAADSRLKGYEWYDRLRRIEDVSITATADRENFTDSRLQRVPNKRPDRMEVNIWTDLDDEGPQFTLNTDVAFIDDAHETWISDVHPLVTRNATVTSRELVDMMMEAYFKPNEDGDGDSFNTQEDDATDILTKTATTILESEESAVANAVHQALRRIVFEHNLQSLPMGSRATINIEADNCVTVEVTTPNVNRFSRI